MIELAIDASTYRGTVAVFRDSRLTATSETAMRGAHSEGLMPAVVAALVDAGVEGAMVDRVICGAGPGSFTSLRIAASIAKGIAMGADAPLFTVSSLSLIVGAADFQPGRYVATLDALRDEWYAGVYTRTNHHTIEATGGVVRVPRSDLEQFAAASNAVIVGAAADGAQPHASGYAALRDDIEGAGAVDLDSWEPSYGRLAEAQVKWEAAHGRALQP
jgi:tRNA threonylcarbamoyladenosine biosynthesis protein TsaB